MREDGVMARLTAGQLQKAARLQRAGATLREIAGEMGVSFEAVCLGLYGDNAGWGPQVEADDGGTDDVEADCGGAGGAAAGAIAAGDERAARAADAPAEPLPSGAGLAGRDAVAERAPEAAAPGPADQPAAAPAEEGGAADEAERVAVDPSLVAPRGALSPSGRGAFRLADELGQWLDRTGQKMTRDPARAWRGVTAQVEVIQKRHPHLRQLQLDPVED